MNGFAVYALCDPETMDVRYIGYSGRVQERYKAHLLADTVTHRGRWIGKLGRVGFVPFLRVFCIVGNVDEAKRIEIALIAAYKQKGIRLTNSTTGGDGVAGTLEVRAKQASAASIPCTEAKKAKISASLMGRPIDAKRLAILTRASRSLTREQIEKRNKAIAEAWTPERCLEESVKVSQRLTTEHHAKMLEAARKTCLGKPRSEKDRASMRAGWARRKAIEISAAGVL